MKALRYRRRQINIFTSARASTVHEIKSELNTLKQAELAVDICLRLYQFQRRRTKKN